MSGAFFFGYGSLVNRRTHVFEQAHTASAKGWRRAWRYTPHRQVAFLTAVPDPDCTIDGLIAHVPNDDWAALDEREAAYDRHRADHCVSHPLEAFDSIAIYAIPPSDLRLPDPDHPVLLSYIDVVVQGYLAEFGADGAAHFFATTTGWDAPVLDDRSSPRYPRAQRLTDDERAVVDAGLQAQGARRFVEQP